MLCSLMHYLTSFIFGTTFAVIDYIDDDINKSLEVLLDFHYLFLPIYYLQPSGEQGHSGLASPINYFEGSDIMIDLLKLRYVQRVSIKDCESEGTEVLVEHLDDSRTLSKCIPEFRGAKCKSLVRKVVIRKMPQGCSLSVMGYTSHLNWYIGCIKGEYAKYTIITEDDTMTTSYEKCIDKCFKDNFIGLFKKKGDFEIGCYCFPNLNGIVFVKPELCGRCKSPDFCGGEDSHISVYYSERSKETPPASWECIYTNLTCQPCDFGWKGYNCELSDCKTNNGNYGNMTCHNIKVWGESFSACSCPDGHVSSEGLGSCSDINECAIESICPEGQICRNTIGSFACNCQEGHQRDETGDCKDVDECNTVSEIFCEVVSTICSNSVGSYSCRCRDGFRSDDMKISACEDIDECKTFSVTSCDVVSTICVNNAGSYGCQCRDGFRSDDMTPTVCQDVDECLANPCDGTYKICTNTPGSFECSNTTSKALSYFGIFLFIILWIFLFLGFLYAASAKPKSKQSSRSASSVDMEVHVKENFE